MNTLLGKHKASSTLLNLEAANDSTRKPMNLFFNHPFNSTDTEVLAPRRSDTRALHSVSRSMWGPCRQSNKRGRARGASDLEGPGSGVVWMPYQHRKRRCSWEVGRRDAALLLKHPNTTVATYVCRQSKHSKHASEILEKNIWKTVKNHCNHTQTSK
jgi:hypothetical protein